MFQAHNKAVCVKHAGLCQSELCAGAQTSSAVGAHLCAFGTCCSERSGRWGRGFLEMTPRENGAEGLLAPFTVSSVSTGLEEY